MKKGNFVSADALAVQEGISLNSLKLLTYKPTNYNYLRFKNIDGKLFIRTDFNAPFRDELDTLRQKALIIAHTENNLCKQLSLLSLGTIKKEALQKYFYRYRFKQIEKALNIIELLKKYINQNSIFEESELTYE